MDSRELQKFLKQLDKMDYLFSLDIACIVDVP